MSETMLREDGVPSIRDQIAEGLPLRPEHDRRRWLAAADRWRVGGLRRRSAAEQIYRALAADLDSADAIGRGRVMWLIQSASILDERLYEIALRFESPSHKIDRHLARLTAAKCLGTLGRLNEATRLTELLVDEHYGAGTTHEINVLSLYVTLLGWQQREIEMAAVCRALEHRVAELRPRSPTLELMVRHRRSLTLSVLEVPRERILEDIQELAAFEDETQPISESLRWRTSAWIEYALAEQAARVGDTMQSRIHIAAFEALTPDGAATPWSLSDVAPILGRIELRDGNPERALKIAERARESTDRSGRPFTRSRLQLLALEAALTIGDSRVIDREVGHILKGLDPETSPCSECAGVIWRSGVRLARLLRSHSRDERSALLALEFAADALLRRVEETERLALARPSMFESEDPDALEFRQRFAEDYFDLVEPLQTAITERSRHWSTLFDLHGQLQVCAWCLRARGEHGSWIPVGHLMPANERVSVSHGICERCASDQLAKRLPT